MHNIGMAYQRTFGTDKESEIVRLILEGRTDTQIREDMQLRRASRYIKAIRIGLMDELNPRLLSIARAHVHAKLLAMGAIGDELRHRIPTMGTHELATMLGTIAATVLVNMPTTVESADPPPP